MPECWNCDREVSWEAKVCPRCGHPEPWREPGKWYADVNGEPPTEEEKKRWAEESEREQRMFNRWAWAGAVVGGVLGLAVGGVGGLVVGAILAAITVRVVVIVIWAVFTSYFTK